MNRILSRLRPSFPDSRWFLCAGVALAFGLSALAAHGQTIQASADSYAAAADAQSTEPAPEVAEMQKISDLWDEAVNQHDTYGLDLVLSPKLVDISSAGQVSSRDQIVARLTQKNSPIVSLDQSVATVRVVGKLAIVNGTYAFKFHKDSEGKKLKDETGVYSQVFERLQNTWVCINSQRTAMAEPIGQPRNKKAVGVELGQDQRPNPFNSSALQREVR